MTIWRKIALAAILAVACGCEKEPVAPKQEASAPVPRMQDPAYTNALNFSRGHLKIRKRVALQNNTVRVQKKKTKIILLEEFTDIINHDLQIIHSLLMLCLQKPKILRAELTSGEHGIRLNIELFALHP